MDSNKIRILILIALVTMICIVAGETGFGAGFAHISQISDLKLGSDERSIKNSNLFIPLVTKRQFENPRIYQSKSTDPTVLAFCSDNKCIGIDFLFKDKFITRTDALELAKQTFVIHSENLLEYEKPDWEAKNKPISEYFYWKPYGAEITYVSKIAQFSKVQTLRTWLRK